MLDPQVGVMLTLTGMRKGKNFTNEDVANALRATAQHIINDPKIKSVDMTHNHSGISIQVRTSGLQ